MGSKWNFWTEVQTTKAAVFVADWQKRFHCFWKLHKNVENVLIDLYYYYTLNLKLCEGKHKSEIFHFMTFT